MTQKTTPDERFLYKLYDLAHATGDESSPISISKVAQLVGLKETAAKNIVKHLAQANFLKKVGEGQVAITTRGCDFVLSNR